MEVDATVMPQKLLHNYISLDLVGDTVALLYPKWIPGFHGPRGPISNIFDFRINDANGNKVLWERDWADPFRFFAYPDNAKNPCTVHISYICDDDMTVYGQPNLGSIDWPMISVYPEGIPVDEITVEAAILVPDGWQVASALPFYDLPGKGFVSDTVTLDQLFDMPVICGQNYGVVGFDDLAETKAEYSFEIIAPTEQEVTGLIPDDIRAGFARLFEESEVLFSRPHFEEYKILCAVSSSIHQMGVEHRNSSINFISSTTPAMTTLFEDGLADIIPHEFVHSWCGKYRRPLGMSTPDYHAPQNMDLLWVYEGLGQYLGWVVSARAGLINLDHFKDKLAHWMSEAVFQKGGRWRSLRDTQVSAYTIWEGNRTRQYLKRSVDFYTEGALLWLEIDARIRQSTDGKKSLDDFCAKFFGKGDRDAEYVPFDYDEVISTLNSVADGPWDELIMSRLNETWDEYDHSWMERCGYRLAFTDQKPAQLIELDEKYWMRNYSASLGIMMAYRGIMRDIIPDSPADLAGLYPGLTVTMIDSAEYSHERLDEAVKNSPQTGVVNLQIMENGDTRDRQIIYNGGPRFYFLERIEGTTDILQLVITPRMTR
jgi:predicted metalloprotease with PDZ domain